MRAVHSLMVAYTILANSLHNLSVCLSAAGGGGPDADTILANSLHAVCVISATFAHMFIN